MVKQAAWVVPQAEVVEATTAILADNPADNITRKFVPALAPAQSGETVNVTIDTLPAGKSQDVAEGESDEILFSPLAGQPNVE